MFIQIRKHINKLIQKKKKEFYFLFSLSFFTLQFHLSYEVSRSGDSPKSFRLGGRRYRKVRSFLSTPRNKEIVDSGFRFSIREVLCPFRTTVLPFTTRFLHQRRRQCLSEHRDLFKVSEPSGQ